MFQGSSKPRVSTSDRDTRAWWKRLGHRVSAVAHEATRETAVVPNVLWKVGHRQPDFIELEGWGAVVAARLGVVEQDRVGLVVATNCDAVK